MRLPVVLALALLACAPARRPTIDGGAESDAPASDAWSTDAPIAPLVDAFVPGAMPLASGVRLDALAIFQGTRVALFEAGAIATRNAPIVAGRAAVVRAYVDPLARAGSPLSAELELREGGAVVAVLSASAAPASASSDDVPASVFSFDVPAERITTTVSLSVRIVDPAGHTAAVGTSDDARLPRDGSAHALAARSDAAGLHLVLVPLRWDHDGSGRLPDTSDAQLAIFRSLILSVYPLVHLTIDVHDPVPWSDGLTFSGNVDFGAVNAMLMSLRDTDHAPAGAYYYALVNAADTYDAYCGGSCVTGQSYVTETPEDADFRVGSGVGFSGESTAWTLVHEVGHEHGRSHAPCDAGGADAAYPYAGGSIGVWGYDARTHTFQDPSEQSDFMGYCWPTWTSDYTWSGIFERTVAVSALARTPRTPSLLVRVGGEIGAAIVGARSVHVPRSREHVTGSWLDAQGRAIALVSAPTITQSHTDERLAVFPPAPPGAAALAIGGRTLPLDL